MQAPGEKRKKNLFGKKLSFTKGKERIGSEDTLSGDDCELIILSTTVASSDDTGFRNQRRK